MTAATARQHAAYRGGQLVTRITTRGRKGR
jgi:hypothetical protein